MSGHTLDPEGPARLLAQPDLARVLAALTVAGEETRLVGGCVRDALLGRDSHDIDLATTLPPDAVIACAARSMMRAIPTGIEHGTVTLLTDGSAAFEVTTLREDVETDGRHAVVRFGRDFARDAERRDFTINALSLSPDGTLHDTTGGTADLALGNVRFIGEARTRIREDALRILRFFRFHARYGTGAPDPEGLAACIDARDALDRLSRERVRAEFLNLLLAPGIVAALTTLSETGLLMRLLGGLGDLGRFAQFVSFGGEPVPATTPEHQGPSRLPSDCAPTARDIDALDRLAILAVFSEVDADRLRVGLRLSNGEHAALTAYAKALIALRSRALIDEPEMRRLAATHDRASLGLAAGALSGEGMPTWTPAAAIDLRDLIAGAIAPPHFPITGSDLIARGIRPGVEIGRRLATARQLWLADGCPMDEVAREALLQHATA